MSCWWSEGRGWQYWGEIEMRSKFWGKSVEMMPTGSHLTPYLSRDFRTSFLSTAATFWLINRR